MVKAVFVGRGDDERILDPLGSATPGFVGDDDELGPTALCGRAPARLRHTHSRPGRPPRFPDAATIVPSIRSGPGVAFAISVGGFFSSRWISSRHAASRPTHFHSRSTRPCGRITPDPRR